MKIMRTTGVRAPRPAPSQRQEVPCPVVSANPGPCSNRGTGVPAGRTPPGRRSGAARRGAGRGHGADRPSGRAELRSMGVQGDPSRRRIYTPSARAHFPLMVFLPGSGLSVLVSPRHARGMCRNWRPEIGCSGGVVDYRPLRSRPTQVSRRSGRCLGEATPLGRGACSGTRRRPARIMLAGDSAAATMPPSPRARAATRAARRSSGQILLYPVTTITAGHRRLWRERRWLWADPGGHHGMVLGALSQ